MNLRGVLVRRDGGLVVGRVVGTEPPDVLAHFDPPAQNQRSESPHYCEETAQIIRRLPDGPHVLIRTTCDLVLAISWTTTTSDVVQVHQLADAGY